MWKQVQVWSLTNLKKKKRNAGPIVETAVTSCELVKINLTLVVWELVY